MTQDNAIIPLNKVQSLIYTVRGEQVMLDSDLAEIYGVETKMFNRAVKRNAERFPEQFRFQLTKEEYDHLKCQTGTSSADDALRCQIGTLEKSDDALRSQNATLKKDENLRSQNATSSHGGRGQHRKYLPYVFTEQGVSMLSVVLSLKNRAAGATRPQHPGSDGAPAPSQAQRIRKIRPFPLLIFRTSSAANGATLEGLGYGN